MIKFIKVLICNTDRIMCNKFSEAINHDEKINDTNIHHFVSSLPFPIERCRLCPEFEYR